MGGSSPADRETVRGALSRYRIVVTALVAGVLLLAAASGLIELDPLSLAERLSLPVGLAGLITLVFGWRTYVTFRDRAADVEDIVTGCARYGTALLAALAMTEGVAFLGIVVFILGGSLVALTGVAAHVLLTGVLWPSPDKLRPFLGRAANTFSE